MKRLYDNLPGIGIAVFLTTFIMGCSSPNIPLNTGKPLPSVIKTYKHMTLRGGKV